MNYGKLIDAMQNGEELSVSGESSEPAHEQPTDKESITEALKKAFGQE